MNRHINIASVLSPKYFVSVWKVRIQSDNVGHGDGLLPAGPGYCASEHVNMYKQYVPCSSVGFTVLLTLEQTVIAWSSSVILSSLHLTLLPPLVLENIGASVYFFRLSKLLLKGAIVCFSKSDEI